MPARKSAEDFFSSPTWRELTALWRDAFPPTRLSYAKLRERYDALERKLGLSPGGSQPYMQGAPENAVDAVATLLSLLERRIRVLEPRPQDGRTIREAAPDWSAMLRDSTEELGLYLRAARGLNSAGCTDPWVQEVFLPDLGVALLAVEQGTRATGVSKTDAEAALRQAKVVRDFLGPGHPVLPELRLAQWTKSKAWAELKGIYEKLDKAKKVDGLGEILVDARDRWNGEMAGALPNREDLAADLYSAIGALYQWKMDRLYWSFDPRRDDAVAHLLERTGRGYRALWALEEAKTDDPWIAQVFGASIRLAIEELAAGIEEYQRRGGDNADLLKRARKAVETMRAHKKLGPWSDWS